MFDDTASIVRLDEDTMKFQEMLYFLSQIQTYPDIKVTFCVHAIYDVYVTKKRYNLFSAYPDNSDGPEVSNVSCAL
jgi:hypothetical protein